MIAVGLVDAMIIFTTTGCFTVRAALGAVALLVLVLFAGTCANAQALRGMMPDADRSKLNSNRVGLVTGPSGLTYIRLGDDLAKLLDDHENLEMRVIVMTSRGSLQNIDDLINLQGVDLAIVQSDVLEYLAQHGGPKFAGIQGRIGYLARLYDEELHVLARPGIDSFADLRGKRVNLGEPNSGTYLTGTNLLGLRGIEVVASYVDHDRALAMLEVGALDAILVVAGKPAQLLARIMHQGWRA